MAMKYVRHELAGFVLFPNCPYVSHAEMGRLLGRDMVVSAGFAQSTPDGFECFGFSESLNIGPGENDTLDLRNQVATGLRP